MTRSGDIPVAVFSECTGGAYFSCSYKGATMREEMALRA
jgi:hypothetical protein